MIARYLWVVALSWLHAGVQSVAARVGGWPDGWR